ncbi:MAG: hemolysin family protein [Thermoplasmatota archaeon]
MDTETIVSLIALVILIYLSGRFSGSETALTSLSKVDIAHMRLEKEKNANIIHELKSDMDNTITTILIGNNIVNITASALATKIAYDLLGNWGISIAVGVMTIILLIFGEISPKGFAIKNKKRFSKKNAKLIYYLSKILHPLIEALNWLSDRFIELFGGETEDEEMKVSESDVRHLASIMEKEGVIKKIEKDILHRVFWFGDVKVESVKVPREQTFVLDEKLTVEEGKEFITEHGYTRMPVTEHGSEEVIGILYSKDILSKNTGEIGDYIREEPYDVSNKDDITKVFERMRNNRIHMAIVLDEEGEFDGIITLEDIMEELVGEIYDEFDEK